MDPATDAVAIRQIRARLDSVRALEHRPVVGLVLSGGGAKGAAQVGVLKYIEELDIPVDMICGTSIGGLMGGVYAAGIPIESIHELYRTLNWDMTLSDRIDSRYISYSDKMRGARYIISLPFHRVSLETGSAKGAAGSKKVINISSDGEEEVPERKRAVNLGRSVFSGLGYGFNVNNLISSMTVGYHDSLSFAYLPIPFVCVASDVVSGKAKNWSSGSLKKALRSTMSIPGLFDPLRTDGMILIDGGTRNNYPTDIARAVGCDYIIGVELSDTQPSYDEINNISDILGRLINMLGKDAFDRNVKAPDAVIKPDLVGFNMMSFDPVAVDTMYVRGYKAAVAQREALLAIRRRTGRASGSKARPSRVVDISRNPVRVREISFAGVSDKESLMLSRLVDLDISQPVDKAIIDDAMSKLKATEYYDLIEYDLLGAAEPYNLVFSFTPSAPHEAGFGFRIDSEESASLLLDLGLNTRKLSGSTFELTARIGRNLNATAHYALDLGVLPTLNVSATGGRFEGSVVIPETRGYHNLSYWTHEEKFYLTDIGWKRFNYQIGADIKGFNISDNGFYNSGDHFINPELHSGAFLGAFARGNFYSFDNYYYPSRGFNIALSADYDFLRTDRLHSQYSPIFAVGFDMKAVVPVMPKFAILPDFHLRNVFNDGGGTANNSFIHKNFFGASGLSGRYMGSQVGFFGFSDMVQAGDFLSTLTLELRYNPVAKLYTSLLAGCVKSDAGVDEMLAELKADMWAAGLEVAYDTAAGPVKLNVHYNTLSHWNLYLSFGFDF